MASDYSPRLFSRLALTAGRGLIGRRFTAAMATLKAAESMSLEQIRERQEQKIRALCEHAARHVPFYRDYFAEHDLAPDSIRSAEDLRKLPVIDKACFRSRPLEDFCSEVVPVHRHQPYVTSGSTGEPFRFVLDRQMMPIVFGSHLYFDAGFGLDPFDRSIRIMGPQPPSLPQPENPPLSARFRYAVSARLQGIYESATQRRFKTTEIEASQFRAAIEQFRPAYVLGYTSTLAMLAEELLSTGWRAPEPMKAAITIAETLTPERREVIERCFRAPIANRYGQREFKFWYAQSPTDDPTRFLVHPELVVTESLRPDGSPCAAGEVGRLVATNLHNFAMPFLRYETGDLAGLDAPDVAANGLPFPVITRIDGRSLELLATPSGHTVVPSELGQFLFAHHDWIDQIRQYQLEQLAFDRVMLRIVPTPKFQDSHRAELISQLEGLLGEGVQVTIETADEIPLERSGKRPIIKLAREA